MAKDSSTLKKGPRAGPAANRSDFILRNWNLVKAEPTTLLNLSLFVEFLRFRFFSSFSGSRSFYKRVINLSLR